VHLSRFVGAGHMGPFTHAADVNELIAVHIIDGQSRIAGVDNS
jgi:hypothetical protein